MHKIGVSVTSLQSHCHKQNVAVCFIYLFSIFVSLKQLLLIVTLILVCSTFLLIFSSLHGSISILLFLSTPSLFSFLFPSINLRITIFLKKNLCSIRQCFQELSGYKDIELTFFKLCPSTVTLNFSYYISSSVFFIPKIVTLVFIFCSFCTLS